MTEVKIILGGHVHGNNTVINITDIDQHDEALLCYTNAYNCCRNVGQGVREWYFPSKVAVGIYADGNDFYRDRAQSVVRLNRRTNSTSPSGVFRCAIPDANGTTQNIYVGIYSQGKGAPTINELPTYSFDLNQIITCTSTGGPATTVEWLKDGQILQVVQYDQQKRIINQTTAEYQSILSLGRSIPDKVIGNYTCRVNNSRGAAIKTIHLYGKCCFIIMYL